MSLGVQAGSGSTSGSRKGALDSTGLGTATRGWRDLTAPWSDLYAGANTALQPGDPTAKNNLWSQILSGVPSDNVVYQDDFARLIQASGSNPLPGGGADTMQSIAGRDPYSGSYETATQDQFIQRAKDTFNEVGTSPTMMEGGTAARGYATGNALERLMLDRGQELRAEQQATAGQATQAAQTLEQSRQGIDQQSLGANTALNQLLKGYQDTQVAAGSQMSQDSAAYGQFVNNMLAMFTPQLNEQRESHETKEHEQNVSVGGGCCFIFLEAYHGTMPTWVRECRDEFAPESTARRVGYIRLSKILVPAMQRSKTARALVWHGMIKPLTRWGGWYKKVPCFQRRKRDALAVKFWFKFWEVLGWL